MANAISTYKTYLMMKGTGSAYTKLIDIKDYAGIEADPELLDATTLSDGRRIMIKGIDDASDGITCTCNYTGANYKLINDLDDGEAKDFAFYFGDVSSPTEGSFTFSGTISVRKADGGVNEVSDMIVTILPTTDVVFNFT